VEQGRRRAGYRATSDTNFRLPLLFDGEYQGAGCSEARASSDPAMEAMSMVGVHCLGVGRDASVFQRDLLSTLVVRERCRLRGGRFRLL
jgi:hypothetical protein